VNTKTLANCYSQLSAEERFRLIMAAHERGDEAEAKRLKNASKRITFSTLDYAPYAQAFLELAHLILPALVNDATAFDNAFEQWRDADTSGLIDAIIKGTPLTAERTRTIKDRVRDDHFFHLWLAHGFKLRTSAAGWKLFCDRLGISPFGLWHDMPGFEQLQRALKTAEGTPDVPGAAFSPKNMARWMDSIRPARDQEVTEDDLISAEWFANRFHATFRGSVRRYGG
jgi:hypothetical protein